MISAVISYCNNDFKFIERNIEEVKKFTNDITISFCDHSFDGERENTTILGKMFKIAIENGCKLVNCPYDSSKNAKYHHNLLRWLGLERTEEKNVLFLDADEILQGELFKDYLESFEWLAYDVISLKCYWYFKQFDIRAKQTEEAGVLLKKSICTKDYIFSENERWEFLNHTGLKVSLNTTHNNQIMCHHYSWVRTKEEMYKKIKCWGHKQDRNWDELIETEFSEDGVKTMKDFIHNYDLEKI